LCIYANDSLKKALYIVSVILISLLLVGGMLLAALTSDQVETSLVRLVTEELSRGLQTVVSVEAVEYRFPAQMTVRGVYIEDKQQDTLLYVDELSARLRPLALRRGDIRVSHVRLNDVVAKVYTVDSVPNYQFLVEAFRTDRKEKKTKDPFENLIAVRDVQLDNVRLHYEDYQVALRHAEMDLNQLSTDIFDAQINEWVMQVTQANRTFDVESLKAHVIMVDSMLSVPTLTARLPKSCLDISGMEVRFPAVDTLRLQQSAHEISFALTFHEARLVPSDLALFAPRVQGLKRPITLSGELGGTLDSLYFQQMVIRYNGQTVLEGDVSAIGLPDLSNPYLRANLKDVNTTPARLQDFLSQLYMRPVQLSPTVHRLGAIHYRGLAEGRLHDLTLHGALRTALGVITTDGTFRSDSLYEQMEYDARIVGRNFKLGRLVNHPKLGAATLDFYSKGRIDHGEVYGDVKAHVRHLTYNDYTYNDLHINGRYEPQRYVGEFAIEDPHLDLAFDGVVDTHDVNPEINFNLRCGHFDSETLGIEAIGSNLRTRFNMAVDLNGSKLDEINGYAVIDSLFVATSRDSVLTRQITLLVDALPNGKKSITLKADYLSTRIDGVFRYADVAPAGQALMHHYLPSLVEKPAQAWKPVNFTLQADGERLRDVQRLFMAPVTLSDHPKLRAEARLKDGAEPFVNLHFFIPGVRAGNTPVHDLTVTLNTIDTLRHTKEKGSGLALSISAEAMQMQTVLSALAFRDTLLTHVTMRRQSEIDELLPEGWRQMSPRQLQHALSHDLTFNERRLALLAAQRSGDYGGDVQCVTRFSRYNKKPLIDMHFMPGTLLLRDSVYRLAESRITYNVADTALDVSHFEFAGAGQHIRANGRASRHPNDTLVVGLQKIDASYVVPFLLPVQTIMFNGLLTGEANITGVFTKPYVQTQIHIDSMGLNNCYFGDAEVDLHICDTLGFHADVYRPQIAKNKSEIINHKSQISKRNIVTLDGKAMLDKRGTWLLDMQTDSVPLAFVNHWTAAVLQDLDGSATGHVQVGGYKGMTYVLVKAAAKNASLTLPWTGVRYTIPHDTIVLDTTSIRFPHVHLVDAERNGVLLNGEIQHTQFHDFVLNLNVNATNALVFDKTKPGEMIQGHVYATGRVDVVGPENDILVQANARTSRTSRFRLSLDNTSSAYESNFIHFVEHKEEQEQTVQVETDLDNIDIAVEEDRPTILYTRAGRCMLKLNLDVTPHLLFQLVLGERNGDMIQARGNGALRLAYDTETEDVSLLGTYDINYGSLSYTVANVIRKDFTVGEGSTIVFSGNPSDPLLNVTAKYRVTASLKDLFGDEISQVGTTRTNIPVLTCMHMTGTLSNPILSFSLEFPQSDQSIQQQVRQVINTDEMLMRQVIYLLVFGRFFMPEYMSNAEMATLNSTYSLLSSTVTSQINAWLSKLTNMFTLGVAIRTDAESAGTSQEYEAQFQIQPVDRLIINGNVGYRYNDMVSSRPFYGDLDVEVILTDDGQVRLKGYTHSVDKYSLRQASTIQGVGLVWKRDFNWPTIQKKKHKKKSAK
jgi:hypothetical protein